MNLLHQFLFNLATAHFAKKQKPKMSLKEAQAKRDRIREIKRKRKEWEHGQP